MGDAGTGKLNTFSPHTLTKVTGVGQSHTEPITKRRLHRVCNTWCTQQFLSAQLNCCLYGCPGHGEGCQPLVKVF